MTTSEIVSIVGILIAGVPAVAAWGKVTALVARFDKDFSELVSKVDTHHDDMDRHRNIKLEDRLHLELMARLDRIEAAIRNRPNS